MSQEEYDEEFGELGLVIGDFNIPQRASDLPEQFKELLVPNKVQYVFCTGNTGCRETTDWIKTLSGNSHFIRGDFDEQKDLLEVKTVQVGAWKIVLVHGHQIVPWGDDESLYQYLREMDGDVLISGHTCVTKVQVVIYLILAFLIKRYQRGPNRSFNNLLNGKIVIVTGASSGIGKETVIELARRKATVILACRNVNKAQKICDSIQGDVHVMYLELDKYQTIRDFATQFKKQFRKLDILINNAGMGLLDIQFNEQGHEKVFAANYMGHFLLTYLLVDCFTVESRIINVSSVMHTQFISKLDFEKIIKGSYIENYSYSKYAQILMAIHMQQLFNEQGKDIKIVALHPGFIRTEFLEKTMTNILLWAIYKFLFAFFWFAILSEKEGALTSLYCALLPYNELKGGQYYEKQSLGKYSRFIVKHNQASELYNWSLKQLSL